MAASKKVSKLTPLSKHLFRDDNDIVAMRKNNPLYIRDLRQQITAIYPRLKSSNKEHWALAMQDSFHFVAGLLALFYAGKRPILIDPLQTEMRCYYQALLTDNNKIDKVQFPDHDMININHVKQNSHSDILLPAFQSDSLTLFTSGSTGLPKPIIKTVNQLERESEMLTAYFGCLSNYFFVASVQHEHMYGLTFKIMLALANKAPFVCESIHYQEQLLPYQGNPIIYITSPSIIKTLDPQINIIKCDKVISAGGSLSYQVAMHNQKCLGVMPDEIYGSSETGIIATRQQQNGNTAWQLFPEMRLERIGDNTILTSPLLSNEEQLNDEVDLVSSHQFYLKGRTDKIIKISEKRVSLTYIENKLEQLSEIICAKVIPLEKNGRTILGAVLLLSEDGKQKQQQLGHFGISQYFRQQLKDNLSLVTLPKRWRFIEHFPINEQGKLTYMSLKSLFDKDLYKNE